MKYEVMVYSS